jgi:ribosome-associated protein
VQEVEPNIKEVITISYPLSIFYQHYTPHFAIMKLDTDIIIISIHSEPIRLGQFLKHANHVQDGFEAKIRIQEGEVMVNQAVETRRGRQLIHGDKVTIDDSIYEVELSQRK